MNWLQAWVAQLFPRAADPPRFANMVSESEWHTAARKRGQIPVYSDFVGVFTIDQAGRGFFAECADLRDQIEITDPKELHVVRWLAAERRPEVAHLRPARGPRDPSCASCGGSGHPSYAPHTAHNLICECGGSGWMPALPPGEASRAGA